MPPARTAKGRPVAGVQDAPVQQDAGARRRAARDLCQRDGYRTARRRPASQGCQCYFLGSVMLVERGDGRSWEVNDGQQRMITFSLICARLCRLFQKYQNDTRREGLALRVIFDLGVDHTQGLSDADDFEPRLLPPRDDKSGHGCFQTKSLPKCQGVPFAFGACRHEPPYGLHRKLFYETLGHGNRCALFACRLLFSFNNLGPIYLTRQSY